MYANFQLTVLRKVKHKGGWNIYFLKNSGEYKDENFNVADRLNDICNLKRITNYVNPIGGQELYDKEYFKNKGINLFPVYIFLHEFSDDSCEEIEKFCQRLLLTMEGVRNLNIIAQSSTKLIGVVCYPCGRASQRV